MKKSRLRVSDHALVRYMDRVLGYDVEAVRRELASKVDAADGHDGCCGVVIDGFSYKLVDDTITTVIQRNRQPKGQVR